MRIDYYVEKCWGEEGRSRYSLFNTVNIFFLQLAWGNDMTSDSNGKPRERAELIKFHSGDSPYSIGKIYSLL